jgi:hypothetical protein
MAVFSAELLNELTASFTAETFAILANAGGGHHRVTGTWILLHTTANQHNLDHLG